ncbi:alpha/beta hydrolase family protein [Glaciihabitans tibetensis]|uniref:Alpha/beta hydrolase family protein n=1 Tax=Glaciihabitans tibetensis TaxID=1266600 RepID=A0A2T0VFL3_9MICO|nr:alpha/beta hydrolase family protein [Glaciihabitans tibetensis]
MLGFLVYASIPLTAEPAPLQAARDNPAFTLVETADSVVLSPAGSGSDDPAGSTTAENTAENTGLVLLTGARVDPAAYVSKLSGLAEAGITVVIARPILGFAIVEWRPISDFTALAPGVDTWVVGGHSLGGVRACQYLADQEAAGSQSAGAGTEVSGLVLFASYCAADVSGATLPVLSIAGTEDGLSTPAKIEAAAGRLPASASFIEIEGANHGGFGDYGAQPGDGTATANDADVTEAITAAVVEFVERD